MRSDQRDQEYFRDYPAPIMELVNSQHFTPINATIPFFAPMLYFLVRACRAQKVLEIGTAQGYTSYFLANGVKDNGIRHGNPEVHFFGLDLVNTENLSDQLTRLNLPNTILNLDSAQLTPETFPGITFDLIFQDGAHDTEHVLHEFDVLWPQLRGDGRGHWCLHDALGPSEDAWKKLIPIFKERNYEFVTIDDEVYGFGIIRNMTGYRDHLHWQLG